MVNDDTLLQVNATIIAGLFIFLSISTIIGSPVSETEQQIKDYLFSGYKFISLLVFLVLLFPFAISSVFILWGKKFAKGITAGGFIALLIFMTMMVLSQYSLFLSKEANLIS